MSENGLLKLSSDAAIPSLRLFLSVDIAGSTAFKAKHPHKVQPWLPALSRFFDEFPIRFEREYNRDKSPPMPGLWKTLGDEMVFQVPLGSHRELTTHVCRFIKTIEYYRRNIKDADPELDLKGAAWVAGFPVHNTILTLRRYENGKTHEFEDFVGPSIDIGFRIAKNAVPRKFGLSIEAAYLITGGRKDDGARVRVLIDAGEELKGVLNGSPYPRFWTPVNHEQEQLANKDDEFWKLKESLIHSPRNDQQDADICRFCKIFISRNLRPLFIPFIDGDVHFSERPPDYQGQLAEVLQMRKDLARAMAVPEPAAGTKTSNPREFVRKLEEVERSLKRTSNSRRKSPRKA